MTYQIFISDELSDKIMNDYTEEDLKEFIDEAILQLARAIKADRQMYKFIKERQIKRLDIPNFVILYVDKEDES